MTPKQKRFVAEYLIDLNATQAAIRAGYTAANADVTGPRLLGNVGVAEAIGAGIAKQAHKLEITAEKVLRNLEEAREAAMASGQYGAAIRATELHGKHVGMFVERRETVITERYVVSAPAPAKDADEWAKAQGPKVH
jgi:phage terminase small subunit